MKPIKKNSKHIKHRQPKHRKNPETLVVGNLSKNKAVYLPDRYNAALRAKQETCSSRKTDHKTLNNGTTLFDAVRMQIKHAREFQYANPSHKRELMLLFGSLFGKRQAFMEKILGEPATEGKILLDNHFSNALSVPIYAYFGTPVYVSKKLEHSASDQEVYKYALKNHFSAIFTKDAARKSDKDLCYIANEVFDNPENAALKYAVDTQNPTGIVLFPNTGPQKVFEIACESHKEILEHLNAPSAAILDLR